MGYIIARLDGTTDGLGDRIVFGTADKAWEAAKVFESDPASDNDMWLVYNERGADLGVYPGNGAGADEAIRAMLRDGGLGDDDGPSSSLRAKPAGIRGWLDVILVDEEPSK